MKKLSIQILTSVMILILTSANLSAQTRIRFAKGASSAKLSGSLPAKGNRAYLIRVSAGQRMQVEVTAGNKNVVVQIYGADYRLDNPDASNVFQGEMEGGEYRIVLYNNGKATKYKMGVVVE